MKVLMRKRMGGLEVCDDAGHQALQSIRIGASVMVDIKDQSKRSNQQHNYWFAILTNLFESQELYKDFEHFRKAVLIHLGRCKAYPTKAHGEIVIADSVSPSKMPANEYSALIDATLNLAVTLGFDRAALEAEVTKTTGARP